jgi:hypothetical protein
VAGTIVGGITGFIVRVIGERIDTDYEWLLYGCTAGAIGFVGIWLGEILAQGQSAKLLVLTFLLVFAGSETVVRFALPCSWWRRSLCVGGCPRA